MAQAWIEIIAADGVRHRYPLKSGLTIVGGPRADVDVGATDGDQLHVWDRPPKMIFIGAGASPRVNGAIADERELRPGDVIEWRGVRAEFGGLPYATIEEIHEPPPPVAAPVAVQTRAAAAVAVEPDSPGWRRIKAGLLVEQGLADPAVAKRWQDAILRDAFDADACARELLAAPTQPATDARLLDRCVRLQRDLVMAPLSQPTRGPSRKMKNAASNWLAMALVQFLVFSICCILVMVSLFVIHLRWGWSVDEFFDSISSAFSGS